MPRRGVFQIHRGGGEPVVADVNTAILLPVGAEYRVSHPVRGGDDCLVLAVTPELVDEVFASATWHHGTIGPIPQLGGSLLEAALRRHVLDPLEAEEVALRVLGALTSELAPTATRGTPARGRAARRHARVIRVLLASDPTRAWRISTVARAVGCSPFHLARQFKEETGFTIHGYLVRLRLALAVQRLAEGETDVARLAADLGFAHHSHLTARFRRAFGLTPSAVRRVLADSAGEVGMLLAAVAPSGRAAQPS